MPSRQGCPTRWPRTIVDELRERGLEGEPLGIDMSDMVTLDALHRAGIHTTDAQRVMLAARKIKTEDEKALLDHAAAIVDAVYERIYELLRPGVREHEIVAEAMRVALRARLGAGRGDQRRLGRPLQPASARLLATA